MARSSREVWKKRVERWRGSDLTAREFADGIGVNAKTLAHWKWTFEQERAAKRPKKAALRGNKAGAVSFTELVVEPAANDAFGIEIVVDAKVRVRVGRQFDDEALRRVLGVLGVAA